MKRLLAFGCFADDSQRVLAAIQRLAFVFLEFVRDLRPDRQSESDCGELLATVSADSIVFDKSELCDVLFCHADSFPQLARITKACGFQTAPLPVFLISSEQKANLLA